LIELLGNKALRVEDLTGLHEQFFSVVSHDLKRTHPCPAAILGNKFELPKINRPKAALPT
jgi:hypothetical protein